MSGLLCRILSGKGFARVPFGTGAAFWINLQAQYDLETIYRDMHKRIEAEVAPLALTA